VRLVHEEVLIDVGGSSSSQAWRDARADVVSSIEAVHWPLGSDSFSLYVGADGKAKHQNGVVEIKKMFVAKLADLKWGKEVPFDPSADISPGDFDACKQFGGSTFCVEWETGNISSSHRSLNKMTLALTYGLIDGGILVVPTRVMYRHLTDRIGNYEELRPYLPLWRRVEGIGKGILAILAVEQDRLSASVPRIGKGTNGRALR
jgi:hypothetical protein